LNEIQLELNDNDRDLLLNLTSKERQLALDEISTFQEVEPNRICEELVGFTGEKEWK
jgi:hypothetical protein